MTPDQEIINNLGLDLNLYFDNEYFKAIKLLEEEAVISGPNKHEINFLRKQDYSTTDLIISCIMGDLDKVKTSLESGAKLNICNNLANKLAIANGHMDIVKYLNDYDKIGDTKLGKYL